MNSPTLSIIIITFNEADNIRACLDSVAWADEIVVVDSGSADETISICREFTDKIIVNRKWQGFGFQKNMALDAATGEWVFSIDADERVTPSLREELENAIKNSSSKVYSVPRQAFFMGRAMRHGGWWPDYVDRLFYRGYAHFSDDLVHEKIVFEGNAQRLKHPLKHYSYVNLEQVLDKLDRYSTAGAQQAALQNRKSSIGKAIFRGFWAFFRAYVVRAGCLDGKEGFIAAVSKAEGSYYRQLKLLYSRIESANSDQKTVRE